MSSDWLFSVFLLIAAAHGGWIAVRKCRFDEPPFFQSWILVPLGILGAYVLLRLAGLLVGDAAILADVGRFPGALWALVQDYSHILVAAGLAYAGVSLIFIAVEARKELK